MLHFAVTNNQCFKKLLPPSSGLQPTYQDYMATHYRRQQHSIGTVKTSNHTKYCSIVLGPHMYDINDIISYILGTIRMWLPQMVY